MQIVEERSEVCSVASKLVNIKIYRIKEKDCQGDGEIVGFSCNSSSTSCETRCTYRLLLEDF